MLTAIFQSIVVKWVVRRIMELGPPVGGLLTLWGAMPESYRDLIAQVLQGNWGLVSLGTLVSLGGYLWSYVSTVKPHATADGVQVPTSQMTPAKKAEVKEAVKTTVAAQNKRPNILESLFKKR
jgi:hypothetical protein